MSGHHQIPAIRDMFATNKTGRRPRVARSVRAPGTAPRVRRRLDYDSRSESCEQTMRSRRAHQAAPSTAMRPSFLPVTSSSCPRLSGLLAATKVGRYGEHDLVSGRVARDQTGFGELRCVAASAQALGEAFALFLVRGDDREMAERCLVWRWR
jgi:hypothetical protein